MVGRHIIPIVGIADNGFKSLSAISLWSSLIIQL
jgi:hypothetical protein